MGNIDFDIKLTPWLTFSSVNNFSWDDYAAQTYTDPRSDVGSGVEGRISEYDYKTTRRYTNQLLRFNRTFGKHSLSALLAYEFSDYTYKTLEATATGFVPGFSVLTVAAIPEATKGYVNTSAIQSVLFNANYSYDNRYLGQVSARRDGASNFGDNAKYGNFYSISGGWLINRESFFSAKWVDILKLRAAYGSVGNRPSNLYPQYDLYEVSGSYDGVPSALISQIGNKDLTWEKTYTTGIGIDFSFLERFRVNVDYYSKRTDNTLFQVPIPGLTGVTSLWKNIGTVSNSGVELVLGADIVKTSDIDWSADFNIGLNRNRVESLYKDSLIVGAINVAGSAQRILIEGRSFDTWYMQEWAGVNAETGAPQWYKTNAETGSREITELYAEANQVASESYTPDFFGGLSSSFRWRRLDANVLFNFSVGGKIYNYARMEYDSDGTYTDRNQMKLLDGWRRWSGPGDAGATHPATRYNNTSQSNATSTRYLEDGSYLKLRNISLGYNLPMSRYGISNLRLSLTAENLFTWTGYSGVDPEISVDDAGAITGTGTTNYPITRKFMIGINITL
jgi:TonB-linked SusC/RagA family outer membrane protein